MSRKIVVTGASGFVGRALAKRLQSEGEQVLGICRNDEDFGFPVVTIPSLEDPLALTKPLNGADVVVHCAARAHQMQDTAEDPLSAFRKINRDMTLAVARKSADRGVRRFIFLSTIKVNGESTSGRGPFRADEMTSPEDPYGFSKLEAEQGLIELAAETGMEVVIIRPPLVYGPGVKGNFASMIRLVDKGLPLPLGAVHNKRSLVALGNLVDLIITCISHPAAANQVFLAGDSEDLSTTELLRAVAVAMGKPSRLIPLPAGLLMAGAALLGKKPVARRLLDSLQVDISKAQNLLGWEPPLSVHDGLRRCFYDC
ncbi:MULTISPECIES: UDP-glucose 4-epimerase family protein [unclassified Marinobacter]|uniref:UDP-glucose 4-epimerase family protein n=1 Tax=unclassified Marinobacter TaxID=83889 RepID=UPI001925B874|nr:MULTISPECIES: SDR family oxidoreductase [unclassified Marinobacter]MBL3824553.1 SDR family oxidoreductase [Marinobacter sp. MC3]MBL3893059.1 SDR family oxidoreductase [Marinobacter sp. MW3]